MKILFKGEGKKRQKKIIGKMGNGKEGSEDGEERRAGQTEGNWKEREKRNMQRRKMI